MQFFRKIFFYIFTAIYVITCPLLILYAFGYIYNPEAQEGYSKTGLIYLATDPAGATIYVDGKLNKENTPSIVRNLLPGEYPVKLELEGYRPWVQTIPVAIGKATVLDQVLLIPVKWESSRMLPGDFADVMPLQDDGFFLVHGKGALEDIHVCDYSQEKAWSLLGEDSPFKGFQFVNLFSSEDSSMIVVQVKTGEDRKFLWIQIEESNNTVKDITALVQDKPIDIRWSAGQEDALFILREGVLKKIDVDTGAIFPEYVTGVKGYGLLESEVYVLKDDNTIVAVNGSGKVTRTLLDDSEVGLSVFGQQETFDIKILSQDLMLFLGEKGELLANRLPYRFVAQGVKGVSFYRPSNQLLIWQKNRIGILDFSTEKTGDGGFEKGPKLIWVYSNGKNIEQCFWAHKGSHVLFRDGAKISLLAIESYGEFILDEVFEIKHKTSVYYSDETGKMYFLDLPQGMLRSVEIVPKKGLIETPFPEITEDKKKTKLEELWNSDSLETN
jgi:hypothetical protein